MRTAGYQELKRGKKKSKLEKLLSNSTTDILDQIILCCGGLAWAL